MSQSLDTLCQKPSDLLLLESAFRSFFAVFATHILAGEVDTVFAGGSFAAKISWLVRYFNPVNLCWRYYSMLAYRFMAKTWGERQLALINFEAYPFRPPIPYIVGETVQDFWIRRLEISGIVSSQGLLSIIAAYQGIMAVQFTISSNALGFLPTISKPLAILGLFRFMVSNWVASKVYVEPYPYPTQEQDGGSVDYASNQIVTFGWAGACLSIVLLSMWPYIGYPEFQSIKKSYLDLSMEILYQYIAISIFLFHIVLLTRGPCAFANRILYFDHWVYKLQTLGFVLLLFGTLGVGILDFVVHGFYRYCE